MVLNSRLRPALSSRAALWAAFTPCLLVAGGCTERESESLRFSKGATDVEVTFRGTVTDAALFGPEGALLDKVHPQDATGVRRGQVFNARPGWLHFEYQIDGERREVLVAKQPILNQVSWDDIARAGAVLADDSTLAVKGAGFVQGARVKDARGHEYRVRLPTCGLSTLADLSEWNLLIGAVHRGDMDFSGATYGWIKNPYSDKDLKVGFHGSLNWCQESLRGDRVARGYFFVSRFHAAEPELRTDRLYWRPVLERINSAQPQRPRHFAGNPSLPVQWSPSGRVGFAGTVSSDELFGPGVGIGRLVPVDDGTFLEFGRPDWLRFVYQGKSMLVAAKPVRYGLSRDAIVRAGAALGDDSTVRLGWRSFRQNAEVKDLAGARYRVRLLKCGSSTLDMQSEWNALMGGVHRGDGDFLGYPLGAFAWLPQTFDDQTLHVGIRDGGATWCQDTLSIDGKSHGVNRGFMTISRFHATESSFAGSGFGWRPVLEVLP
jgi:hypothetical protein